MFRKHFYESGSPLPLREFAREFVVPSVLGILGHVTGKQFGTVGSELEAFEILQ